MERIWLKSYPEGVPAEVDVDAFSSIVDLFEKSVTEFADRPAYVHMGATLTYVEVDRLSRDFAAFLREGLKLHRGARVALMMPNVLQYPIALFGALRGGCVVVNCNPLYTPRELERQLIDCGAEAVCQRRRVIAAVGRSESAAGMQAKRPPIWGAFLLVAVFSRRRCLVVAGPRRQARPLPGVTGACFERADNCPHSSQGCERDA